MFALEPLEKTLGTVLKGIAARSKGVTTMNMESGFETSRFQGQATGFARRQKSFMDRRSPCATVFLVKVSYRR